MEASSFWVTTCSHPLILLEQIRVNLISMVTRLRVGRCWVRILVVTRDVFKEHPNWFWNQPNLIFNGLRGLCFVELKWPEREPDHLPAFSATVQHTVRV